jgi:hypothetical protein
MGRFQKGSFKGLLIVVIWLSLSQTMAPAVVAKEMRVGHNLIAQHIASAKGAVGHEKRMATGHPKATSDTVSLTSNGRYEDIDRMSDNAKTYAWLPSWLRHVFLAAIVAVAGLIVGWMVLQVAHMQGFNQEGPQVPIACMVLFLLLAPFTNYFDDFAVKIPGLQQMVPYTDLAHENQREFIPVRSGAFGLTLELPQPFMVTRALVQKTWITSLLYSRKEGSYSIAYCRVPQAQAKEPQHDDFVVWDVGHSLDLPEPSNFESNNYDVSVWLDKISKNKVKRLGATNATITPVALYDRYPGRTIEGTLPDGNAFQMRLYTGNNNLYTLLVTGTPQWVKSSDSGLFLDSFNLD